MDGFAVITRWKILIDFYDYLVILFAFFARVRVAYPLFLYVKTGVARLPESFDVTRSIRHNGFVYRYKLGAVIAE